jgi:hypothetical protein
MIDKKELVFFCGHLPHRSYFQVVALNISCGCILSFPALHPRHSAANRSSMQLCFPRENFGYCLMFYIKRNMYFGILTTALGDSHCSFFMA